MRVALISPSDSRETSFVQFQTDFVRCMREFIDMDYISDKKGQFGGVDFKDINSIDLNNYDLIHFQWGNNPLHFFEYHFMKKVKFNRIKIPIVSTIHEVDLQYLLNAHKNGWLYRYYQGIRYLNSTYKNLILNRSIPNILTTIDIINNSDITIFNSRYAKDYLMHESSNLRIDIADEKIIVAALGTDSRRFSSEETINQVGANLPKDTTIFLYVGYLHPIKSIDLAIKAFYYISQFAKRNDFFFLIIGDGPYKSQLQKLANDLIPKNHAFLGYVDDIVPYYKMADIVINPRKFSRGEVSGVIPEAFSGGKLIIAPNIGCNNEYITKDRGYLTNKNDELDYMDAILYFLENPEYIHRYGNNAQEFALGSLDWRSQRDVFIKQYERLL